MAIWAFKLARLSRRLNRRLSRRSLKSDKDDLILYEVELVLALASLPYSMGMISCAS